MHRALKRRIVFSMVVLLCGVSIAEGVKNAWLSDISGWPAFLFTSSVVFLAAILALVLEHHLSPERPENHQADREKQLLEADFLQLNRELEAQSEAKSSELARLNLELDLQIARHKQAENVARTSEERFRNMADNIQEGLTIIEEGRLVYVNERACEIFGECPEGDLWQRITRFALPEEVDRLQELQRPKPGAEGVVFPSELQYWIQREDGTRRCIREHYSTSLSQDVHRIFVVTFDVTERIQAVQNLEQAVDDRTRELFAVLEVSKKIASTLELEPLLNLILDQIQSILPYSGAAIFTLEEDTLRVVSYMVPGIPTLNSLLRLSLDNGGPCLPVIREKKVVIIDDVHGDTPLARAFRESLKEGEIYTFAHARSWIGIPLVMRDHVTGLMSLAYHEPGYYKERHAHLAETITNQAAVAIENARLYEQAQNLATLEERHRIARELHDSVTQLLYGICLYSTATIRSIRKKNYTQIEENLAEIKDDALQALQEMRLLILELNPPLLQKEGFVAALRASLEVIEARTGLETELRTDGVGRLPRAIEPELYRIAMEALNNLVRYARAKKVTVDLQARGGWVFLEINDNGIGFDLEKARNSGGMGLFSMEQRARQLQGRLEITSSPGSGTKISAEIPAQERMPELVR